MQSNNTVNISKLNITPVDPNSPIPLYYQIENDLRRLISSGKILPQTIMPPELELCKVYGVGRHTMRMALSRLVSDNLITRRAGRGTVVQAHTDRMKFYLNRSFTRQMADMGRSARSEIIETASGVIETPCHNAFQDKIGAGCLTLTRLRFGDDEPIGIQFTTLLTDLCPNIESYDLSRNSLYDLLSSKYQLVITAIHHVVCATTADEFQAELLDIAPGDPLLVVDTTAFLDDGQAVEHTVSYYRSDKFEYSITDTYSPSC